MLHHVVVFTFACITSVLSQYPWLTPATPKPKEPFEVRLVDGLSESEGRLEVFMDSWWGTVCGRSFSNFYGDLACKQLGYDGARYVNKSAAHGTSGSGPIMISDFYCEGTESYLWQCNYQLNGYYNCDHKLDVAIGCFNLTDGEIPLRLYNDGYQHKRNAGMLEVFYNGTWGFICQYVMKDGRYIPDKWGLTEADVACKQLHYERATSAVFTDIYVYQPKFVISSVQCMGSEDNIGDCNFAVSNYCKFSYSSQDAAPAAVICSKSKGDLSSGKIGGIVIICIISIIMFITIPVLIFITRKRKQIPEQTNRQEVTPVMHSGNPPYQDIS